MTRSAPSSAASTRTIVALVCVLGATLGSCRCAPPGTCESDTDCDLTGAGYRVCDLAQGLCACVDDRGCGEGEKCASNGRCLALTGCADNEDCGLGFFCNVNASQCVPKGICGDGRCCTLDSQCGFGQICDGLTASCISGCRDDADCPLSQGCSGAALGSLGHCGNDCTADNQCRVGQLCNLSEGRCVEDTRGPYCLGCSGGVQSDNCGAPGNFCLIDTYNGGSYCGVDCSLGQGCALGYACIDVIILPPSKLPTCSLPEGCVDGVCSRSGDRCTVHEDCPTGPPGSDCPRADIGNCELDVARACDTDADCPEVGACLKQQCRVKEGAAFGVCSCTMDTDCPRDRCLNPDLSDPGHPVLGHCEFAGRGCYEDAECETITCVHGGCLIGRNCKPANDRSCADLLHGR